MNVVRPSPWNLAKIRASPEAFEAAVYRLSSIGFKILVDLLASSPTPLRVRELPYVFRNRLAGESKLDNRVAWDYLMLLADKTIGRFISPRFVSVSRQ
jgi:dolichol-phosphate mannosyltransferase